MSRPAYFGRWLWFWLACYAALVAGLVWWLTAARRSTLSDLASTSAQNDWQAWRDEVRRQQDEATTVQRRVPVSTEPPATVLLRDNFGIIMTGAIVLGSVLYWVMAWLLTGALTSTGPSSEEGRDSNSMGSTTPAKSEGSADVRVTLSVLRWRDWPLADWLGWSWIVPLAILSTGAGVGFATGNVWLGVAVAAALALSLWKFLLPIDYELNSVGFSRRVFGWRREVPWQAVGAYQARATGIVLFQRDDPAPIDALWSEFLPYSADEVDTLCTVRHFLPHAVELSA